MAFLVSPGVEVKEQDLINIIPAVATSIGGFAGVFEWGPAAEVTNVSSEKDLIEKFGYPRVSSNAASSTRLDWYSAANFLGYTNSLQLVRVISDEARNAGSEPLSVSVSAITIIVTGTPSTTNAVAIPYDGTNTVSVTYAPADDATSIASKLATELTNAGVANVELDGFSVTYPKGSFTQPSATTLDSVSYAYATSSVTSTESSETSAQVRNYNEFLIEGTTLVNGSCYARYPGKLGNSIGVAIIDAGISKTDFDTAELYGSVTAASLFDDVPGTSAWGETNHSAALADEVHVVVYTTDTQLTGTINETLEVYPFLSKAKNGKTADGAINFYVDVINDQSDYIYIQNEETFASSAVNTGGLSIGTTLTSTNAGAFNTLITNSGYGGVRLYNMAGGKDGTDIEDGDYTEAYDLLSDVDNIDVNLLITGSRSKAVQKHVVELGETRKDCVTFVSPSYSAAVTNPTAAKVVEYFNSSTDGFASTSYAVFDSGWKRQYDRYNDEYFWIPLNADIAGLAARTDSTNDAWWSPAGLNRGFIKNVVKLSFNPNQADRDALYTKRVNPVVTFRGQGTLLYGDKTALSRPSAFDRINVRRLFIVLEKAIATAAKYQLFEFNDDFTRRVFLNAVEPFLAEVKTRRGVYNYKVVCDESNNTAEVVDNNRFVADIYIKPTRSINFITLSFTAVRSGVSFNEVVGA